MSKKFYMTPESEELMMEIESSILAGSAGASNIEDGDPAKMDGDDDKDDDGF